MGYSAVFIAISRGGVMMTKEVVLNIEEEEFMAKLESFKKINSQYFCTFLMEKELQALVRMMDQKKGGIF